MPGPPGPACLPADNNSEQAVSRQRTSKQLEPRQSACNMFSLISFPFSFPQTTVSLQVPIHQQLACFSHGLYASAQTFSLPNFTRFALLSTTEHGLHYELSVKTFLGKLVRYNLYLDCTFDTLQKASFVLCGVVFSCFGCCLPLLCYCSIIGLEESKDQL